MGWDSEDSLFRVVVNHEEQYSIWPEYKDIPAGWRDAGKVDKKQACLDYINEVWTDMRPLSLRRYMDEQQNTQRQAQQQDAAHRESRT